MSAGKGNKGSEAKNRNPVKPGVFKNLRQRVMLTQEACAELCGVTKRTIRNWETHGAPEMALKFLHMYDRQDCSSHGSAWRGFKFSKGKLICGKLSFTPKNLKTVPYYVDVFNRVQAAKHRYELDGYPLEKCLSIVFGSDAFAVLPLEGALPEKKRQPVLLPASA